jgi:hypothetical protein
VLSNLIANILLRGFVEEGRKRKCNWLDGKWADSILFAILEDEFWAKEREKVQ